MTERAVYHQRCSRLPPPCGEGLGVGVNLSKQAPRRSEPQLDNLTLFLALAFGYLLGSIPFGLLFTRAAGLGELDEPSV